MAIQKSKTRVPVLLTYDEREYLDRTSYCSGMSMSKYLEWLLQQDMRKNERYDDPEYILSSIQALLSKLKANPDQLLVNDEVD